MTILEDVTLIGKKILVTVVIYLLPVTILVGGLLLTRYALEGDQPVLQKEQSKTSLLEIDK